MSDELYSFAIETSGKKGEENQAWLAKKDFETEMPYDYIVRQHCSSVVDQMEYYKITTRAGVAREQAKLISWFNS